VTAPASDSPLVVHWDGSGARLERSTLEELLAGGFFWLDLHSPAAADLELLQQTFGFHPLALEDSWKFGQRPKLDDYGEYMFLVVYGASPDEDRLVEMHCFYSPRLLVTIHRDDAPSLVQVRERLERRNGQMGEPARVLHAVVDGLVDGFFPMLSELDDRIDQLEDGIFASGGGEELLQEIFAMKRLLVGVRKVVAPQRDLFSSLSTRAAELPGMTDEDRNYFRDLYDHQLRIADLVDTYRDLLTGAMDVYLSTVSNRLNSVMKQLAIIATVFMPLTFIVGFFGQNFGWMVDHVGGPWEFLALGIGLELAAIAVILAYFRQRGWLAR
jgi:magnesium transporter